MSHAARGPMPGMGIDAKANGARPPTPGGGLIHQISEVAQ